MKSIVTQKSVLNHLKGIYPKMKTFDEIANDMNIYGVALVDLQYALSRLYQTGRLVRICCSDQCARYKFSH